MVCILLFKIKELKGSIIRLIEYTHYQIFNKNK